MKYTTILTEKQNNIGIITLNRLQVLNALDKQTITELTHAIDSFEQDETTHVVIITGKEKAFIAGADIKQMQPMTPLEAKTFSQHGHQLLNKIEQSCHPYIAAVNGFALGGGCELMMACDIIIASKTAKIGQPEINLGISPGFGGTQRLPRLVGNTKAKELLLTGETITAEEAFRIGLINKITDPETLMQETMRIAQIIATKSPIQTNCIKNLVNQGMNTDLVTANNLEIATFSSSFATHDQKEGMNAFLEKRKPTFTGK